MRILLISDHVSPGFNLRQFIIDENPQLIITLGDLSYEDLSCLKDFDDIPKVGVYGNHCKGDYFSLLGIRNMHLQLGTVSRSGVLSGINFFGFEGCVKYKDDVSKQYTQDESLKMVGSYFEDKIDVIISHAPPKGMNDSLLDKSHLGFEGLRRLIDLTNPAILFHGHTYPPDDMKISLYKKTVIYYVSGVEIYNTDLTPDVIPQSKSY
jgi:Icc-related predicted phosphoesterase